MLNEKIKNAESIVLMAHKHLDGDALGAMLALGNLIKNEFGKEPVLAFEGVIPDNLRFLSNGWWLKKAELVKDSIFDLAIIIDVADTEKMIDPDSKKIWDAAKERVKIDHHLNSKEEGGLNIIKEVSSSCEIIANMAWDFGWAITDQIARFLYTGIYTDTGGFIYDYTTPATMMTVAKLMETNFDHTEIVRKIAEKNKEIFLNNAETLARTIFTDDTKIGYTTFSAIKVTEGQRPHRETSWLHKQILAVKDTDVSVIFKESEAGLIFVSVRAKRIPINGFAEQLGGGGHLLAAAFSFNGTLAEAVVFAIPKLQAFLNENSRV